MLIGISVTYYYVNKNAENQWIFIFSSILYNLHFTGKMEWGIYIKHIFLSQRNTNCHTKMSLSQ